METHPLRACSVIAVILGVAVLASGCGENGRSKKAATTTKAASSTSCEALEAEGRTGICADHGAIATVVNRGQPLKMDEFTAKLQKDFTRPGIDREGDAPLKANGVFVIFQLQIKNNTNRPLNWSGQLDGRVELSDGENIYAHTGGEAAFWLSLEVLGGQGSESVQPIQPHETRAEFIGFDVPESVPGHLDRRGAGLLLIQSKELSMGETPSTAHRYGNIRLWQ